jgi:hypothetical protein
MPGARDRVANLWTEFAALHGYAMSTNVKECENHNRSLVAATFEKAITYVFAATAIRDREVGGSNPLAPTKKHRIIKPLQVRRLFCCSILSAAEPSFIFKFVDNFNDALDLCEVGRKQIVRFAISQRGVVTGPELEDSLER